jgi:CRISPR-associated protein Cmr6
MSPIQACRPALRDAAKAENASLLLDFYLTETRDEGKARRSLLESAAAAAQAAAPIYRAAFERWTREVATAPAKTVRVASRLIAGLGAGTVLETGITLHHNYGVPMIPGSALKGLASAYCDKEWGARDPVYRKDDESGVHRTLFGTGDESGCIIFHDAWILPASLEAGGGLKLDVMTPHHTEYYMKGGEEHPPADTDAPVPVAFLSVAGDFRIAVSCNAGATEERKEWAKVAMELLLEAVADWGAGGKTSSGYGRMREIEKG